MIVDDRLLLHLLNDWEPPALPHCSNCRYAKVHGNPSNPMTYCKLGYGKEVELATLIRQKHPRQFVPAVKCDDFASMGPPTPPRHAEVLP